MLGPSVATIILVTSLLVGNIVVPWAGALPTDGTPSTPSVKGDVRPAAPVLIKG